MTSYRTLGPHTHSRLGGREPGRQSCVPAGGSRAESAPFLASSSSWGSPAPLGSWPFLRLRGGVFPPLRPPCPSALAPAPLTETPVRVLGRPDGPGRCPVSRALVPSARSPLAREGAYRGSWASGRGHPRGHAVTMVFTRTRAAGTRCRGRSGVSQTKRPSRRRGEARRAGVRRGHGEDGEASGRVARAEDPQRGNARRSGQAHREAREPL